MALKGVVIDPVTRKFVSTKSERGMEILAMQFVENQIPSEEEEIGLDAPEEMVEEDPRERAEAQMQAMSDKYAGIEGFEQIPFIKERLESGMFVKTNTERQDKNDTLAVEVHMGETSKVEKFVFYKKTGHVVRNGKTFIHRGYKDCGNLPETAEGFEKYWTRREAKYMKSLEK